MATGKTNASTGGGNQSLKEITFDEACSICQSWESGLRDIPRMLIFVGNSNIDGGGFFVSFEPGLNYLDFAGSPAKSFTTNPPSGIDVNYVLYIAVNTAGYYAFGVGPAGNEETTYVEVFFVDDTPHESFEPGWSARYFTVDKGVLNSGN